MGLLPPRSVCYREPGGAELPGSALKQSGQQADRKQAWEFQWASVWAWVRRGREYGGGGGFNKGWEKVLGRRWWRHKIQPGQERVCRKQKCWSWSKKHTLETSIKPAVLCNRDESGLKPIFNKTTRDAVSSLTRKLFGCVIIKCSSTHFDISECACLGCGRAELFVFPGLSLKSGKMFFALS